MAQSTDGAASMRRIILTNNENWNFDSFALSAFH